jgi:hypothetical protein
LTHRFKQTKMAADIPAIRQHTLVSRNRRGKMRDRQSSQEGTRFGSSHSEPSVLLPPMDDDAGLVALETQFNALVAEMVASRNASDAPATYLDGRLIAGGNIQESFAPGPDGADRTEKTEAVLARLYPIEQAIMATPARTIKGLGVKARHVAYVLSHYWEAPIDRIDWDARAMRLLIEAICGLAYAPLPSCEAGTEVGPRSAP